MPPQTILAFGAARAGADAGKGCDPRYPIEQRDVSSVAVLPLENLSGDARADHLCDGFTDDIINKLTRFRGLHIVARHSAYRVKEQGLPPEVIGRQLGVRHLLTGALRRADSRLTIHAQLIDTHTGSVVWSEPYDGEFSDLFAIQDDVIAASTTRLGVQIGTSERHRALYDDPPNLQAYGLVLRGEHLGRQVSRVANLHARRLFEQAADLDPSYARGYAALSRTYNRECRHGWSETLEEVLDRAVDRAETAVACDGLDARGYSELGYAWLHKRQHAGSLVAYQQALELNPNDADIIADFADALVYDGQPARSVELMQKAMQLNPYSPDWYFGCLAGAYDALGRSEDVIATVLKMQDPNEGRRLLAANYAALGMTAEARAEARNVLQLHPQFSVANWAQRLPYKDRQVLERYMDGLRRAGLPEG